MKLSFSTRWVKRPSFYDTCVSAYEYGFAGFEIYDALGERRLHTDSILRGENRPDAKRKLRNRSLEVAALTFPYPLESGEATSALALQYVTLAADTGVEFVIFSTDGDFDGEIITEKMYPAIKAAEKNGVEILFETAGALCHTQKAVELINSFSSVAVSAAWNVRETFFSGDEAPETTIKNLGAYIRYVRLGDRDENGADVLIGEGALPVQAVVNSLNSLNYDGFVCVDKNDEISDSDIVLTHFAEYIALLTNKKTDNDALFFNRAHTGTFPWKKYDVLDMTFPQVLDAVAELYPDQYAFKYTTLDYTRTYSQFRRDVDRTAAAFIAMGVKPGHHIAVWATNIPQWFISFWAACRIGAVLVTVNTAYRIHEAEYLLHQSDTHTLILCEGAKDINYGKIMLELCPELKTLKKGEKLYSKKLPFLRNVVSVGFELDGCLEWNEMLRLAGSVPPEEVKRRSSNVKPDDVCNMQYTSGTTGFPKGVMLTHRNIINNGKIIGDRMDLSTADRMMIQVPMFHCFGMVLSMTSMMTHGGTLSPLPYFSAKSALACITAEKITCFNGVPTMFIAMFNHPDFAKTDFSHIRTGIMAGANCPPELMKRASVEMNMTEIISVYGQTEAAPGCTMGEVNESLEKRTETVGTAFPGVECKIIDPETGKELPDGENGEFVARGFNIMKGYYKMPDATAQTIDENGWLHSGDICCRTPDGYYKVTGRLKDMIIRGGENIYPREIEEFYLTNEKVKDVQVIGVPDKRYGEEACAWIILRDGETADADEMTRYGLSRMASHKVPRYFVFVDDFPMNAAGKILKYKMREETAELIKNNQLK